MEPTATTPDRITGSTGVGNAAPRCPMAHGVEFDPLSPEATKDPMPWLRRAQRETPVFFVPKYDYWFVTRYDDIMEVVRDTETYSSSNTINLSTVPAELVSAFPDGRPDRVLASIDPPDHDRLRQLAQAAFTPKMVEEREGEIRAQCHALIDAFVDDGHCDLVSSYSEPLPVQVITMLVGAPMERTSDFQQWAADRVRLLSGALDRPDSERFAVTHRLISFSGWLRDFVELRRAAPRDDLTTALVQATTENGGAALTTSEIVNLIGTILSAGSSTTINFITALTRQLLAHQDQLALIRADPALMKRAVEEGLRLATSVYGLPRLTTRPVTLGGVDIDAGQALFLHYAAAQRDGDIFPEPDTFDVERDNLRRHLAFGRGIHTCLGAPLARLESRVAVECLLERLPGLRLVPDQDETWVSHLISPGLARLELAWG